MDVSVCLVVLCLLISKGKTTIILKQLRSIHNCCPVSSNGRLFDRPWQQWGPTKRKTRQKKETQLLIKSVFKTLWTQVLTMCVLCIVTLQETSHPEPRMTLAADISQTVNHTRIDRVNQLNFSITNCMCCFLQRLDCAQKPVVSSYPHSFDATSSLSRIAWHGHKKGCVKIHRFHCRPKGNYWKKFTRQ